MRFVILNMMLLGIATCVVDDNVFARSYEEKETSVLDDSVYKEAQLVKSLTRTKKQNIIKKSTRRNLESNIKKDQYDDKRVLDEEQILDEEQTAKNTENSVPTKSNIPPAPPLPKMSGPTPPPPPPMGMTSMKAFSAVSQQKADISAVMEDLRSDFDEFLAANNIKTMANVVNLYLQGNKEKISEGISTAEASMMRLSSRLDTDLKELNKLADSNPDIEEFSNILQKLPEPLKKLSVKGYRSDSANKSETFREISFNIRDIAHEYFQKVMTSGKILKSIPNLKALKDAEIVLERAVVLSDSFSNLVDLSEQSRNEAFSERATQDVLLILNLKRYISNKLQETDSASSKNFVSLPTGDVVTEKEYLEIARSYIDATCEGHDQLQKLLDMRDVLNNKYTTITSNDQVARNQDPLAIIRKLDDRIAGLGNLLQEASEKSKNDNYSQFGNMFTEGDVGYGGALIASVNQWIPSDDLAEFSNDKIRSAFRGKELTGDIVEEYLKLLTSDMNLCRSFAKSVISTISRRNNFKASSYASISKQAGDQKEDRKVLLEITNKSAKLGTSSDPKKDKNLIPFSMLRKNCEEYVKEMASAENDIKTIPETLDKIKISLSKKVSEEQLVAYINNILNSYFIFKDFQPQGDQISFSVVNTEKGLLSASDTPNVVFALAQNCNLAIKQPALPLFPTSKDTNNLWVLKMALDLQTVISRTSRAISHVSAEISSEKEQSEGLTEIIDKLNNLGDSIKTAIYQEGMVNQVTDDLQNAISNTEKKISATKDLFEERAFDEISDNLQNLSKSVSDISVQYAKNQTVDGEALSQVIENLQQVDVETSKTIAQSKSKSAKSEKQPKIDREKDYGEFIR